MGDTLELQRQLLSIDHIDRFLKYQQEGDATTFLFNWSKHQKACADMHDSTVFNKEIDVGLDAQIVGDISVVMDQTKPMPVSANAKMNPVNQVKPGSENIGGLVRWLVNLHRLVH